MYRSPYDESAHESAHEPGYDEPGYDGAAVYIGAPSPARRRKLMAVAAGALTTLLLAACVVDRVAERGAERRIAVAFQDGMDTTTRPSVHIRGFPVLPQLTEGALRHVDITAYDVPARGSTRPLPVTRLDVALDDLKTSGDAEEARARAVDATAFLSYEDLSNALGLGLSQDAEPGRVEAALAAPLAGEVAVSTAVSAAPGNRVAFTDFRLAQGEPPAPVRVALERIFAGSVPLRNIPQGLHLRSVTPTASGLDAHFTGHTVTFRPDSSSA
ncbi:DUF2993 domain-containing protein [Streptomyces pseudovenezuelae]|uniref:LmeA family phospholipid-binding protein n=1 Tax=Streptomyces pseudovenezuelae TaxID=67350 RepID=UPI002E343AF8|nr:DUF2993 domain-containing protein [Streptomyces pseudovenezuelae]WUA93518.1 DUF2993 domain-containing protein [Streptomyces pseudovenezuelae]